MLEESESSVKLIVRIKSAKEEDRSKIAEFEESNNPVKSGMKTPNRAVTQSFKQPTKSPAVNKSKNPLSHSWTLEQKENLNKKPALKDNIKYTIYTSSEPSDTVVVSNKPIAGRLINNECRQTSDLYDYSHNLMKDATLLEFTRIYSEIHRWVLILILLFFVYSITSFLNEINDHFTLNSIDNVYVEQIKDKVSNLFTGKNSSVIFFGPTEGGKSFLCRGFDLNDGGVLGRAAQEVFNLIEISEQANVSKQNKTSYFTTGFSCYQIYNDTINDLLSNNPAKQLQVYL